MTGPDGAIAKEPRARASAFFIENRKHAISRARGISILLIGRRMEKHSSGLRCLYDLLEGQLRVSGGALLCGLVHLAGTCKKWTSW